MAIQSYPAYFYEDVDSVSVRVPDLPYILTFGKDFEDAYRMAVDAIAGYIDSCRKNGEKIPAPSDPTLLEAEKEDGEEIVMVSADFDEYIEKVFNAPVGKIVVLTATEVQNAELWKIDLSALLKKALWEEIDRCRKEQREARIDPFEDMEEEDDSELPDTISKWLLDAVSQKKKS